MRQNKKKNDRRRKFHTWGIFAGAMLVLGILYLVKNYHSGVTRTIDWNSFEMNILARHAADSIAVINGEQAEVYIKREFADDTFFRSVMKPWGGK